MASEVTLAVVLLAGAGFLLKSLSRLLDVKTGINAEHVLTATINLPAASYAEPHEQLRFVASLLERLQQVPEMTSVAISTGLPFASVEDSGVYFAGNPEGPLSGTAANHYRVTPDYFRTLQVPLIRGRLEFHEHQRKNSGRRYRRNSDGPARRQTRRAAKIDGGISRLGGAACDGRCRVDEERLRRPGAGRDLHHESSQPFWPEEVAAILGITPAVSLAGGNGGASSVSLLGHAAAAIASELCDLVLVIAAAAPFSERGGHRGAHADTRDFEMPYGVMAQL